MGRYIVINGKEIHDAGVYGEVNVEGLNLPIITGKGDLHLIGEAEGGEQGEIEILDPSEIIAKLGGGDLADACHLAFRPGADEEISGGATKIVCSKTNNSTLATGALSSIDLKTTLYGAGANYVSASCAADPADTSGYARILTAYYNDGSQDVQVVSDPGLGYDRPLSLKYSGVEATATVANDGTKLVLIIGAVTTNFAFATYNTMTKLKAAIENLGLGASLEVTTPNPMGSSNPAEILDIFTAQSIKTVSGYALKIGLYECLQWLVNESVYLNNSIKKVGGETIPDAKTKFALTGGGYGASVNTDFQNRFDAVLEKDFFNQALVMSSDLAGGATFAAVMAQFETHIRQRHTITGRVETIGYLGGSGNFAAHKANAALLNYENAVYVMQGITDTDHLGNIKDYPAWGKAVVMAQSQLGGAYCTNMTYKKMPYLDLIDPTDFDNEKFAYRKEANKAGILVGYKDLRGILRVNMGITSKIDSENNGYIKIETRESLIQYAKQLRVNLDIFVGKTRRAPNYQGVVTLSEAKCSNAIKEFSILAMQAGIILNFLESSISVKFVGNYLYPVVQVQPIEGTDFIFVKIDAIRIP